MEVRRSFVAGDVLVRARKSTPRITIILSDGEHAFKRMIHEMSKVKHSGNPYSRRGESEIAKMLLEPRLHEEHERICRLANDNKVGGNQDGSGAETSRLS
jgi:hypothetical protein